MIILLPAIIANAFGRRFAGGLLGHWLGAIGGTQVARLAQAAIAGLTVAAVAQVWWWGLAAVPLTFLGATWGFPRFRTAPHVMLDMRASHMVPQGALDTVGLAFNGAVATAPLAIGAFAAGVPGWWLLVLAGLARGPLYWLAAAWTPAWRWLEFSVWAEDQQRWILQPTALTEFYAGGALGAALVLALWSVS